MSMAYIGVTRKMLFLVVVAVIFNLVIGKEVTCEEPVSPEHGSLHLLGDRKVDSLALYSCNDGWKLVGASASKCLNTGQWTSSPPRCIEKGLSNISTPTALVPTPASGRSPIPERKATPEVIDTSDTHDTPLTPEHTEEEECSCTYNSQDRTLSAKANGLRLRYGNKVKKGDKMTLRCYDQAKQLVLPNATSISGTLNLTCDACQTWTDSVLPSCGDVRSEITCRELNETDLMKISYTDNLSVGSIANFHCFAPGIRSGVARMQCLQTGKWSHSPPTCQRHSLRSNWTFQAIFVKGNTSSYCSKSEKTSSYLDVAAEMINKAKTSMPKCSATERNFTHGPVDCADILSQGQNTSGVYRVWPMNRLTDERPQDVYCDMETDGGGWTVIQRRGNYGRPVDFFYKDWKSYKEGFGDIQKDFWLGNDNIFALTNQKLYSARFDLEDKENSKRFALYDYFWIDDEFNNYTLHLGDFSGNAGDSMKFHNNQKFSTKDVDNDSKTDEHCAFSFRGAWWYNECRYSNLNGLYLRGETERTSVNWWTFKENENLESAEIKIRPKKFKVTNGLKSIPQ